MNVLSIDFDYFQKTDRVTLLSYFPAPYDYSIERAAFEWMLLYSKESASKYIRKVEIMEQEFDFIRKTVKSMGQRKPFSPCLITNSHGAIYDFIYENVDTEDELNIVNIDMHHDFFGEDDTNVNCANWAKVLKKNYENYNNIWIKNPYLSDVFETDQTTKELTDLESVKEFDYDLLFLCRSDNFTVPHLDKYFEYICKDIDDNFNNPMIESGVSTVRDYEREAREFSEKIKFYKGE